MAEFQAALGKNLGIPSSLQTRVIGRDKPGLKKCSNSGREKQNRVPIISVKKQRR